MERWSLQDAKAKFSEFVRLVVTKGPHIVTKRGKPEVVVMSIKEYEALKMQRPSLSALMRGSPLAERQLDGKPRQNKAREFEI